MLLSYLNDQRNHVFGILEELEEESLRQPVLPSGWNCLGLVQHLALDVERFWFRCVVAGDQVAIDQLDDTANAWDVDPAASAEDVLAMYRQQIELSNAIIAETPLDNALAWWPDDLFGDWRMLNVRQAILHTMTETACHAGHLDAVRELIDGRKWLVLTA
jgi:uncharacterized damage-inducible protein DinB